MLNLCSRFAWLFFLSFSFTMAAVAQQSAWWVKKMDSSHAGVSYRGMSAAGNGVVWVGGSSGTIGRSTDGGTTWEWKNPIGYEKRDFRDIHAFDANTAVAMAVDSPGTILKTNDGGHSWRVVYEDHQSGVFLDAMDFRQNEGICVGDPIDGRFYLLQSNNHGDSWQMLPAAERPEAKPGEACFAASGTNILIPEHMPAVKAMFVSGGAYSRLFMVSKNGELPTVLPLPMMQGAQMTGANSILAMPRFPMVAGGDYLKRDRADSTIYLMDNMLKTPQQVQSSALGYTSCLAPFGRDRVAASGLNGVALYQLPDPLLNKGNTWEKIDSRPWHVLAASADGKEVYMAGPKGSIGKIMLGERN